MVFGSDGLPKTGLGNSDFTKYLAKDSSSSAISVSVSEVSTGNFPGLYVASFIPNTNGNLWSLRVTSTYSDNVESVYSVAQGYDALDALISTRAAPGDAMSLVDSALDAVNATSAFCSKLADVVWRRTIANVEVSSFGDSIIGQSAYGLLAKVVNRTKIAGGVLNIYKQNGSTVLASQTIAATPGATPITELGGAS